MHTNCIYIADKLLIGSSVATTALYRTVKRRVSNLIRNSLTSGDHGLKFTIN